MLRRLAYSTIFVFVMLSWFCSCTPPTNKVHAKKPTTALQPERSGCDTTYIPPYGDYLEVDQQAEMTRYVDPEYPRLAHQAGLEGTVWITVLVDRHGKVADAKVYKSSGTKALDEAALAIAPQNRFQPAMRDGCRVASWVAYKVDFFL